MAFEQCAMWQVALLQMILHRQGWVWRVLSGDGLPVRTDGGIRLAVDASLNQVTPREFDMVVMAGGEFPEEAIENPQVHRFLRQFDGGRGLIAASCASILPLAAAGLLGGRRFTCLQQTIESNTSYFGHAIYTGDDVCTDENIISSKGHAHVEWTEAVCRALGLFDADPRLAMTIRHLAGLAANESRLHN